MKIRLRLLKGVDAGKVVEGTLISRTSAPGGNEWITIDEGTTVTAYSSPTGLPVDVVARTVHILTVYRSDIVEELP